MNEWKETDKNKYEKYIKNIYNDNPEGWYGEGGGFRMGNTCIPVADSFWYMAKPIQYCKVKKKKKKKENCVNF